MNRKKYLRNVVLVLAIIGFGFSLYPLFVSMKPGSTSNQDGKMSLLIDDLEVGAVYRYELGGKLILVLKPSEEQLSSIQSLDKHVWDRSYGAFIGVFVFLGHSTSEKGGCGLSHYPRHASRLSNSENAEWLGGYWDVSCEVSYDYAGRAIKTYEKTYNGFNPKVRNLDSPSVEVVSSKKIIVNAHG